MKWGITLAAVVLLAGGAPTFGQEAAGWQRTQFKPPIVVEDNAIQGPTGFSRPYEENQVVPNLDQPPPPVEEGSSAYPIHSGMPPMVSPPGPGCPPNGVVAPFDGCCPLACQPECGDGCCQSGCPLVRLLSRCCGGCCHDECECPKQWYEKWCLLHWCRSTGDMPLHFPYPPENHGTYYFRPYNYSHIQIARDLVPTHQADPVAPYETHVVFNRVFQDVIPPGGPTPQDFDQPLEDPREPPLPTLEDLLDPEGAAKRKAEEEARKKARAEKRYSSKKKMGDSKKKGPALPPKPGIKDAPPKPKKKP